MKRLSESLLSSTIVSRRNSFGLTQAQVSEQTGINRSMLVRIEHGDYIPTIAQLEALATVLDFDIVSLFVDDNASADSEQKEFERMQSLKTCEEAFRDKYKREPLQSFCPYRVCPLGAHIDHQFGKVHGLALNYGVHMAYGVKENGVIELSSMNFPKRAQFHVMSVPDEKQGDWADHLRGAVKILGRKYSLRYGLCGVIKGSLPIGGLSSSAAVIICFLRALCHVNGIVLSDSEYIYMAKAAENEYVGVSCGKLDQSCEVLCKKNNLLYLDCLDDSYENISIPANMPDFRIAIFFSGLERSLANSAYNNRVDECKASAFALYSYAVSDIRADIDMAVGQKLKDMYLRKVDKSVFESYGASLPETWKRRCRHFYGEMERVEKGAELWRRGDLEGYGKLMFESGKSSIEMYESGCPELKKLYEIMTHTKGIYGGRFSGAGFKGCCMALIDPRYVDSIKEQVEREYLEEFPMLKGKYSFHLCSTADGVGGLK